MSGESPLHAFVIVDGECRITRHEEAETDAQYMSDTSLAINVAVLAPGSMFGMEYAAHKSTNASKVLFRQFGLVSMGR